jgi:hypothetical protein
MNRSALPTVDLNSYLSEGADSPPEVRLWAAVVARALLDACNPKAEKWAHIRAVDWIRSETDEEYSFSWCAEVISGQAAKRLVDEVRRHVELGNSPDSKANVWQRQRIGRISVGRVKK